MSFVFKQVIYCFCIYITIGKSWKRLPYKLYLLDFPSEAFSFIISVDKSYKSVFPCFLINRNYYRCKLVIVKCNITFRLPRNPPHGKKRRRKVVAGKGRTRTITSCSCAATR